MMLLEVRNWTVLEWLKEIKLMALTPSINTDVTNALQALGVSLSACEGLVATLPTMTDPQLFDYGNQISRMKVQNDDLQLAVATYTLTSAEQTAATALNSRALVVYAAYIARMVVRAPNLFT